MPRSKPHNQKRTALGYAREKLPATKSANKSVNEELIVVGIGASAGGLQAFQHLLKNLPVDTGKAFVLIQHLDPAHKSLLVEILSRATRMPVQEVRANMLLKPNHVYVIPPNSYMTVSNGRLRLTSRNKISGANFPIDLFLESLAEELKERAIGVILSGTASDGTIGLKSIKSHGGITFAQDEASAKYPDMPRHAAAAADIILPPDKIAAELAKINQVVYPGAFEEQKSRNKSLKKANSLQEIVAILRKTHSLDLSSYRSSTVERRILRRMSLKKQANMAEYAAYLLKNPSEVHSLYQDIFIHVTNFFREPERYDLLKTDVFPRILKAKSTGDPIRIWVAGCSSGEEVYSIAITLLEFLGTNAPNTPVQIFASDIDQTVIEQARKGSYPKSIEQDVSPERLRSFFLKQENEYQLNKSVRDLCIFAKQDVISDPPFSRLDLISCCNVLIYFSPETQSKILKIFHYALKPSGYLILGKSESIPIRSKLFETADKKHRIFIKKHVIPSEVPSFSRQVSSEVVTEYKEPEKFRASFDIQKEADRLALAEYQHRGLVVDENYRILQFRGDVGSFLKPPAGDASLILTKMLREDLWLPLRAMVEAAKKKQSKLEKQVTITLDGELSDMNLQVIPIRNPDSRERFFLILLEQTDDSGRLRTQRTAKKPVRRVKQEARNRYVLSLERELGETKEYMRSNFEEQEAVNAQLNFANEELQSSNEELQSLNEEMETAKEELESGNEEMITLNEELRNRNTELSRANERLDELSEYSEAIIRTIREPFLILDSNLFVKSANQAFYDTFKVRKEDTQDHYLFELGNGQWNIPALRSVVEDVLSKQKQFRDFEVEQDLQGIGHRIMSLNGRRIVQEHEKQDLILLAIEDVTHRKALDAAMAIKLQEIHHRVKNNLQVISSLMHLQTRSVSDPELLKTLRESQNRLKSVAMIHEKLYSSHQPDKIVFSEYVSDLAGDLFRSFGIDNDRITLRIEIDNIHLMMDDAIPCGLMINELLSNCLKHAFRSGEAGQVRIEMKSNVKNDDQKVYKLVVSDNGAGMPAEIDLEHSKSLGMKIVSILTHQLGGTVKVERGNGTTFQIEFPG